MTDYGYLDGLYDNVLHSYGSPLSVATKEIKSKAQVKRIPTYDAVNPDPGLGQAHKYVGLRLVNEIPSFPC